MEHFEKCTLALFADHSAYHNEKEKMAHGVLLLEVALFSGVMVADKWPPDWIKPGWSLLPPTLQPWAIVLAIAVAWLLLHCLLRWQLRNRRWAAVACGAIVTALFEWNYQRPSRLALAPYRPSETELQSTRFLAEVWDFIWVYYPGGVNPHKLTAGMPMSLREIVVRLYPSRTGALDAEQMLTLSSLAMGIGVIYRTCVSAF